MLKQNYIYIINIITLKKIKFYYNNYIIYYIVANDIMKYITSNECNDINDNLLKIKVIIRIINEVVIKNIIMVKFFTHNFKEKLIIFM